MNVLTPHLAHDPVESPMGFAARLAAFHTGGRTGPFLRDIGVSLPGLARGQAQDIQRLAERTGIDAEALEANAARGLDRRHFDLRGEHVSAEMFSSPFTVFCPACLRGDDLASGGKQAMRRHRWIWQLGVVRTCPDHGLPLMRRKAAFSGDRYHELAIMVPETGDRLEALIAPLTARSVSPLQNYVLDRLAGKTVASWLDGEGLDQAVRASEMLGILVAFGPTPNLNKLTDDDWDRAGAVGYIYSSQGEAGIRQALFEVQARANYGGSNPGPQHVFGRLYQWLSRSRAKKDLGDIKRILREHILDTMEVAAGSVVLGEELADRRLHTCATLARETGLDPRTLRGVLAARSLIPEDAPLGSNHVFDAELGRKVARSMWRLVPVAGLPKKLGCTRPMAEQLVAERILTPIVSEVSHAPGRMKKAIDAEEVDGLLKRFQSEANSVRNLPVGLVDIATAAMKSKAPAVEIVHLILGGFLSNVVRLDGMDGFEGIHVDPAETKLVVSGVMDGLSPAEAFGQMRVPIASGWELVKEGLMPVVEIPSKRDDHVIYRFRPEDVDAFLGEFTTEAWIGNALEMSLADLKPEMKGAGVKPFLRKAEIGIRIFRRCDLPVRYQVA
ncbi:MAG: TniQ family protein [Sulfitobacter sp.]|uniref:TniQ family protein n=1 Tax=Alphaproteobacteria TaxID=28211 RepID=UPI002942C5E4|nr:TniQ family protein [Sulfitobacter sp. LC.270.F.C4]WOI15244.1 TniQ family protein [Sulfitobacter sp. LC.270.F.C4]